MQNNKVLVLGGYGGVGRVVAGLILKETGFDVVIAGRRKERADDFAEKLKKEFPSRSITARYADADDTESLQQAFQGIRLVVVLATTPGRVNQIASAALSAGCDYQDILVSENTFRELSPLAAEIEQKKKTFITQAGFHPGLPAVFVRRCAQYFDRYDKALIAMAMNAKFERAEQAVEIIDMVSELRAKVFENGAWRKTTYKDVITLDMGPFGKRNLFPLPMEELKAMPEKFGLRDTGVYVTGFNWFVDNLVFPAIWITQKIKKGLAITLLTRLFVWGVNTFSSSRQGVVFLNDAEGVKDGKKLKVRLVAEHDDAYLFTAIPVVACIKQYLSGSLPPGVWMMGHAVDEQRLLRDMEDMGVRVRVETVPAL